MQQILLQILFTTAKKDMYITGVELVKQNRFAKISEGNKEKGTEQGKVFWINKSFYEKCEEF